MRITEAEVRRVAELANLSLTDQEVGRMQRDLDSILEYMDQLNALDTSGVEPMAQVLYEAEETATLREDAPQAPLSNQEALGSAPLSGGGYFKVPKVIER
jgi:aspartyl-tRNA(Asn)/glutamyl-tRNA(Gln) amidotransferase subunit C